MSHPLYRLDSPPDELRMDGNELADDGVTGDRLLRTERPRVPSDVDLRVEVFVRSLAPTPAAHVAQVDLVKAVNDLADGGPLADTTVSVWGDRLCRCDTCRDTSAGRAMLDRVRAFEAWAAAVPAAVTVPFDRRCLACGFTGAEADVIVPPGVTIAVYGDASLLGVFPCEVDGESISVAEGLERLRNVRRVDPAAVTGEGSAAGSDRRAERETRLP